LDKTDLKTSALFLTLLASIFLLTVPLHSEELIHTLKTGDTIYGIARKYNIPEKLLLERNDISDPKKLWVGQELIIPSILIVEKGDTLYQIAKDFEMSIVDLRQINKLDDEYILKIGDILFVPALSDVPAHDTDNKEEKTIAIDESIATETTVEIAASETETGADDNTQPHEDPVETTHWPLIGERTPMEGKLTGLVINGRIGSKVISVSSGRVIYVGPRRGFGNVVFVQSDLGYIYMYGGNDITNVNVGDLLNPGEQIGTLGISVIEKDPQMYFMVYKDGKPVEPEKAPRG
jgi:lipoprotein YgeR